MHFRVQIQGDTGHMLEKRDSRPCLLGSGVVGGRRIFSFPCLISVRLADVVISHDSAAPVGRTTGSRPRASMECQEEGGTGVGWTEVCTEEAERCLPADVCDVSCKEEIDGAFLLEVYVI